MVALTEHRTARRARRSMSIESLLVWAFQVQKVHLVSIHGHGSGGADYVRVDASHGSSFSDVHGDAMIVYDAVCHLDQPSCGLVIDSAQIGGCPDWRPRARYRGAPDMWTENPRDALWPKGDHWPGRAAFAFHTDEAMKTGGRPPNIFYCPVVYRDHPDSVATNRRMYTLWADALGALRRALAGTLDDHAVTDRLPPRTPWAVSLDG